MHTFRWTVAALVLSFHVRAQFTMPPSFLTRHNTSAVGTTPYSTLFGGVAEQRMQIISGDWTAMRAVTMKSIAFRRDSELYYTAVHGKARSWAKVTIRVAQSDWWRSSENFSTNMRSTPTQVFNASTNWTNTQSKPAVQPPWGKHNLSFSFPTPHYWPRLTDVVFDFQFSGGMLANSASWSSPNYVLLDGFSDLYRNGPIYNILMTKSCAHPSFFAAVIYANGPYWPRPNTTSLDVFQATGVPLTPHLGAIGVRGSTAGIAIGACQKMHLLHTPITYAYTTSASGSWAQPIVYIPFNPQYIGLPVFSQAAYSHPVTNQFQLTGAMRSLIPALPVWSGFRQLRLTAATANAKTGKLDSTFVPIMKIN